jgi:phosphoribosylformimino-5-aminoimidazole carboxamide ribotide isomerase
MIAIPAVDLRDGACVQLVGGSYADERVRIDDPVAVARQWTDFGFTRLHIVDLDAATGSGSNADVVRKLLQTSEVEIQVGGGVRTTEYADALFNDGAALVVVGTRAVTEPHWLADLAALHPDSIIVAADVRQRRVVTHGWASTTPRDVVQFVDDLNGLALAGILVTAVHKEGLMQGTDIHLMEDIVAATDLPVYASGGVRGRQDLDALAESGVAGAVIGMALYTGAIDPRLLVEEYGA